ncbi:thiamine ABC transporter ATP-binding protein [Vibrio maerlii]|uniref:thiamine ABC transporter ATP-binding protein n=1 Tax=Vibrio maerlii TaxID=2231648 RepID=UPI000E3CFB89|nr:thiamine ABC transporter ATP-binding protein [Vibrio maerlii]
MLCLEQVNYRYHKDLFTFDLSVKQGECLALMGPSGAGKSTLLSLIAGFIFPESGEISVNGNSLVKLEPYQRPLAMLFQEHNLFSHLSVRDNIGLGLNPALRLSAQQKLAVEQAAEQVGLIEYLDRLPEQLSGGQRQRVALARCFVQPHSLWLLDEPFSALDPILREEMLALVKQLAAERNITVIMVTHHLSDARTIASHFAFIDDKKVLVHDEISQLTSQHHETSLARFVKAGE